jgi:hypothetical protein
VIGATAALGTLAALLLSLSLLAYEGAALRADGAQARLLAVSGLLEVERELRLGRLLVPAGGIVWQGTLPAPPPGLDAPSAATKPQLLGAHGDGCGFQISLSRVRGPSGDDRWIDLSGMPGPAVLVDALAEGWCGRGVAEVEARFAVVPAITGTRLH